MKRAVLVVLGLFVLTPACSKSDDAAEVPQPAAMAATLAVDIRDTVDVSIAPSGGVAAVSLAFSGDYGLFDPKTPLAGIGPVETFPEASLTLYTAKLASPPVATGPCGAAPVSLALSLARRGKNARVAGSLTAYCGADTYSGVPARILRITGQLPE